MPSLSNVVSDSFLGWSRKFGPKQALALLLFLAGFFILDRAVALGLERILLASKFRYSELYRGNAANDILIFGNSRGVNGFYSPDISRELGARTLNLSFNGLSMGMSELLLLDYLEINPAPKLIILEVSNLHNEGLNGEILQLYSSRSERLSEQWRKQQPRMAWIQAYAAQSHRFTGEFFLRVLYYLRRSDQDWINRYRIDPAFAENFRPSGEIQAEWNRSIPQDRLDALNRIIDLAKNQGIKVRLIVTPYLPNYIAHVPRYEVWKQHVEESSGLPVTDWSRAISAPEHFSDPLHMNLEGFRAFLPKVRANLQSWLE
jgi:hypothetical protein